MKTKITTLIIMMLLSVTSYSQSSNDIYFIAQTIKDASPTPNGIVLNTGDMKPLYMRPPMYLYMSNDYKEYYLLFVHYNFNLTELKKIREQLLNDKMEIIEKPISFLETINPIDLNELEYSWQTAEEAWEWAKNYNEYELHQQGRKIYFIDRSDLEGDTIKLIEIVFSRSNEPKNSLITEEDLEGIPRDANGNVILE